MSLEQFSNVAACIAVMLFGIYALLRPHDAVQIAHLKPDDANGVAETRINFGGIFLMLGIAPLLLNDPAAYQVVGIAMLGAFVTRFLTQFIDHPQVDRMFMLSGAFELVVGLVLLLR